MEPDSDETVGGEPLPPPPPPPEGPAVPAFPFQKWPTVSSWAAAVPSSVDGNHHATLCRARHAQIFHSAWIFSIHTINFCITLIASCTPAGTEIGDSSQFPHRFCGCKKKKKSQLLLHQSSPLVCKIRPIYHSLTEFKHISDSNRVHAATEMSVYLHEVHSETKVQLLCCSRGQKNHCHPCVSAYYFHRSYALIKCQESLN